MRTVALVLLFALPIAAPPPKAETYPHHWLSSWYGERYHGRLTANGERFDKDKLSAAHRTLPFGAWLLVRNPKTGDSALLRVNDRGPFPEIAGNDWYPRRQLRALDVSEAAAERLGFRKEGLATLEVSVLYQPE